MEISASGNIVTITGNIKSVSDYQSIKSTIDPLVRNDTIIPVQEALKSMER